MPDLANAFGKNMTTNVSEFDMFLDISYRNGKDARVITQISKSMM